MRLKSYTAPSMAEAMQLVREELGEEAIIVSTQRAAGGKGVRITAAMEHGNDEDEAAVEALSEDQVEGSVGDIFRKALRQHGVPDKLEERLVASALTSRIEQPLLACGHGFESVFSFAPLPEQSSPRPFMMVGPPGAGKTMAVAKLVARSALKQRKVGVITTDNMRAGAVEQLAAFMRILDIDLKMARGPDSLRRAIEGLGRCDLMFIDSAGLNPFKAADMDFLSGLIEAADVEPILVMAAGGDATEAGEIAEAFGNIGATRLLATRLDMTRRLGGILTAADAAQVMLCDASSNPHVADGLTPFSPLTLARLIVPQLASGSGDKGKQSWTEVLS